MVLGTWPFIGVLLAIGLWALIARMRANQVTTPTTTNATHGQIWPLALARQLRTDVTTQPGITLLVFALFSWAAPLYMAVVATYEWPRWRSAWQLIWPGIDTRLVALPLILMMLGAVSNWKRIEGRLVSGIIFLTYAVLQVKLALPTTPWSELGGAISAAPLQLVPPLWFATFLVATAWIIAAMLMEFCWPALQASAVIVRAGIDAYDRTQAYRRGRAITQRETARMLEHTQARSLHTQRMAEIEQQDWEAEEQHQEALARASQRHRIKELVEVRGQLTDAAHQAQQEAGDPS